MCTSSIGKSTFGTPKLVHYLDVISIVSFIQECPFSEFLLYYSLTAILGG